MTDQNAGHVAPAWPAASNSTAQNGGFRPETDLADAPELLGGQGSPTSPSAQRALDAAQAEARAGLYREPTGPASQQRSAAYAAVIASIAQYRDRLTPAEIQTALKDPIAGQAFILNDVRHRQPGRAIPAIDAETAAAMDRAMGVSRSTPTAASTKLPDGRRAMSNIGCANARRGRARA